MPVLPDVGPLGSLAGWAVAVLMVGAVLTLVITGKLVPGQTHDREAMLRNKAEDRLEALVPLVKEQGEQLDKLVASVGFLVDFVKVVALERRDDSYGRAERTRLRQREHDEGG